MIGISSDTILGIFLVFCRVGACVMLAPGISSNRIPMKVRLFLSLAVALAVAPMVMGPLVSAASGRPPGEMLLLVARETMTGLVIGFIGRIFFFALQTLVTGIAMAIGFTAIPGTPVDDAEPLPAISSMIMMVATAMIFFTDVYLELFRGLVDSYRRIPVGGWVGPQASLVQIVDQTTAAFVLALRISAPFIIYSVIVNLAVGLTNKLTPQIPVYFLATPFIMFGGLLLIYFLVGDYMSLFMDGYSDWVTKG